MSLDVNLIETQTVNVYWGNITHNLVDMAKAAGIYKHLWKPETIGIKHAHQLISPLTEGVELMKKNPAKFKQFDAPNGWGTYDDFVPWIEAYIAACMQNPNASIEVSR